MLRIAAVLALVATCLAARPALARQTAFEQPVPGPRYGDTKQPLTAQERLMALETQIAAVQNTLKVKEAQVAAGQAPTSELEPLKAQFAEGLIALSAAKKAAERERITTVLYRPVDLQLREATLQQTAEALSRATGLDIVVDGNVGADARLTLEARGVPMAAVLDSVCGSLGVMISPSAKGIALKPWPVLEVNGEKRVFTGPDGAWGTDWGADAPRLHRFLKSASAPQAGGLGSNFNPYVALPAGTGNDLVLRGNGGPGNYPVAPGTGDAGPDPTLAGPVVGDRAPFPVMGEVPFAAAPIAPAVAVAAVGPNLVVVAEPGHSPQGETGFWLTLYRLENNRFKKVSTLFHTSPGPASVTPPPTLLQPPPGILKPPVAPPPALPTPSAATPGDLPTAPLTPAPATVPMEAPAPAAGPRPN